MRISVERTKTGMLAIAAAGIVAAGAVAERANQLYGTASPDMPAAAGKTTVAAATKNRPAKPRSSSSHRP